MSYRIYSRNIKVIYKFLKFVFVSFHERLLHGTSWASIFGAILLVHVYEMILKFHFFVSSYMAF